MNPSGKTTIERSLEVAYRSHGHVLHGEPEAPRGGL
jgi:hypothetical protein